MATEVSSPRQRLETERERLLKELQEVTALTTERRESGSYSEGGEFASAIAEVEKGLINEKRLQDQLADVKHALDKLDRGTYGLCDSCGQPIAPARMEALPQASLCLKCKTQTAKIKS